MKKSFIISAAIIALTASAGAKAADIVTYQQPEPAAVAAAPAQVSWNGFYVGGTIGGSWANGRNKVTRDWSEKYTDIYLTEKGEWIDNYHYNASEKEKIINKKLDSSSFIGGLYAGYNFQPGFLSQSALKNVVFGVETDWLWNSGSKSAKGSHLVTPYDYQNNDWEAQTPESWNAAYTARIRQEWNGATRLRAGYALGSEGRFLPYIAGGVSYAKISAKTHIKNLDFVYDPDEDDEGAGEWGVTKSKVRAGWNIGAGVDYILPVLNDHLMLRAEYRFTDFGTDTYKSRYIYNGDDVGDHVAATVSKQKIKYNQNDFRIGLAYKF